MNIGEGSLEASNDNVLNEAEQLIWALLDEEIGAADLKRLEGLISDNNEVRTRYFHCVQLHSDLAEQFGGATTGNDAAVPTSPVLKGLGDTGSTASCRPPVAD